MTTPRKSETVTFRVDAATLEVIQRAARLKGTSVTAFVTEVAHSAAQRELLDQRFFGVDAGAFDAIEAILAEPPKADAELVGLFKTDRQWAD